MVVEISLCSPKRPEAWISIRRSTESPAGAFRNADSGQAKLGELLPQAVAEAVAAALVAPVAKLLGDAAFVGQEIARLLRGFGARIIAVSRSGAPHELADEAVPITKLMCGTEWMKLSGEAIDVLRALDCLPAAQREVLILMAIGSNCF